MAAQRSLWLYPGAVALGVLALVSSRISRSQVQAYGVDGAEYIEHLSRLEVLAAWRTLGDGSGWLAFLREVDKAFPPLLHMLHLPIGAVLGHRAEDVLLAQPLWLAVLALAVALLTAALAASPRAVSAAACGVLLVPALQGFATRYYYDLPMTALLWLGLAVLMLGDRWSLWLRAAAGGLLLLLAALVKWQALPLVGISLAAVWWARGSVLSGPLRDARPAYLLPLVAGLICGLGTVLYLLAAGPYNSLLSMLRDVGAAPQADVPGSLEPSLSFGLVALDAKRLLFYPLRLISSVLSPLLALLALPLLWAWLRRGRGRVLLITMLVGQALFVLLWVPPLDDRFLVPVVPGLVIAAAIGWDHLVRPARLAFGAVVLLAGAAVALDFHTEFELPGSGSPIQLLADGDRPGVTLYGLGVAGSVEQRGWARLDREKRSRRPAREQLWASLKSCQAETIRVASEDRMIGDAGDLTWFHYRAAYAQLEEAPPALRITQDAQPAVYGPPICRASVPGQPELAVTGAMHGHEVRMPPCTGAGWKLEGRLPIPGRARDVAILSPGTERVCEALGQGGGALIGAAERTAPLQEDGCERRAGGLHLVEGAVPVQGWPCQPVAGHEGEQHPSLCNADYLEFSDRAGSLAVPVENCGALHAQLAQMWRDGWDQPRPPIPELSAEQLTDDLLAVLNLGVLIGGDERHDSLSERPLEVSVLGERDAGGYRELELVLRDPLVGSVHGLLLLPPGEGPFPAVLALPGHGESAAEHRDQRFGWLFPEEGIAALILDTRAYDTGIAEHEASLALLCGGFSLMSVRVYEALLALKFLRGRAEVCNDRIGLIGHSGGSVTGNLLIRLDPELAAFVSDLTAIYFNVGEPLEGQKWGQIADETHPGLARLSANINDHSTASIPVLEAPYGYAEGPAPLFEFFARHLIAEAVD
ncbi:MAG: hypothetical protein CMP23_03545 [Rickettsiales bacterium]|nr:hypothetical protein [Rickettsiales bacterium]